MTNNNITENTSICQFCGVEFDFDRRDDEISLIDKSSWDQIIDDAFIKNIIKKLPDEFCSDDCYEKHEASLDEITDLIWAKMRHDIK